MKLMRQWRYILMRAWSMRLAVLTAVSTTFPLFVSAIPPMWFAGLTMLLAILTALSRIADQPNMDRRQRDEPVSPDRRNAA